MSGDDLRAALRARFGFESFRAGQEEVIQRLLAGHRALALLPTGAGKSLCYQLPALLLEGVTVVVSPLIALMDDQVAGLRARGITAARFDPAASAEEMRRVLEALRGGELRILFVAPESLARADLLACLRATPLALLAIDEAHCISEWGHQFRPDYLRLGQVARRLRPRALLALTATATQAAVRDIRKLLRIAAGDVVKTSFARPNLTLRITPCAGQEREELLIARLRQRQGPAVVYVTRQQTAESVTARLRRAGLNARAYHAGMTAPDRAEAQSAFMRGSAEVIVATIAFGMGIDKANIRAVYHYNPPKSLENYQQETGRAGRDGAPAVCEMFPCLGDLDDLETLVLGNAPSERSLRNLVDHLLRRGPRFELSMYELAAATDLRSGVIETVLTHLELDGLLLAEGSYHAVMSFRLLTEEPRLLAGRSPLEQRHIRALLSRRETGRKWVRVAAEPEPLPAGIESLLQALHAAGEIELRPSGVRRRYRLTAKGKSAEPSEVAARMIESFARQEQSALERLRQVREFATQRGCLTRHLLRHFGERASGQCGVCESCLYPGRKKRVLPPQDTPVWTAADTAALQALARERHPALRGARQLARFLCGLSSPAAARARLQRREDFGLLQRFGFGAVLAQAAALTGEGD